MIVITVELWEVRSCLADSTADLRSWRSPRSIRECWYCLWISRKRNFWNWLVKSFPPKWLFPTKSITTSIFLAIICEPTITFAKFLFFVTKNPFQQLTLECKPINNFKLTRCKSKKWVWKYLSHFPQIVLFLG